MIFRYHKRKAWEIFLTVIPITDYENGFIIFLCSKSKWDEVIQNCIQSAVYVEIHYVYLNKVSLILRHCVKTRQDNPSTFARWNTSGTNTCYA